MGYFSNTKENIEGMFEYAESEEGYSRMEFMMALDNPIEFNNGCCSAFAYWYAEQISNSKVCDSTAYMDVIQEIIPNYEYGSNYHQFLEISGKYYDYEAQDGVDNIVDLPFFKRVSKKLS